MSNANADFPFHRPTWCEIDLAAIEHNMHLLREMLGDAAHIYVCLKGDASGCGAVEVALTAERSGASGFAFGNIDSAIHCRNLGVTLPILLYPTCLPEAAPALEQYKLSPTVSTLNDVRAWNEQVHGVLPVFLKIDSGGFRAGAFPDEAASIAKAIQASPRLELAGVYGHSLAGYGVEDPRGVDRHIREFLKAIANIDAAGVSADIRMCSSSELILKHPEADLNAVDPGRLVCGMEFPAGEDRKRSWQPALVGLKSRLVMIKTLEHAGSVAPAPFVAGRENLVIGLVPMGWSDGYPRKPSPNAHVLVRGKRAPIFGPIHSELMRIDLTDVPDARVGDEVVFLGASDGDAIDLRALSGQWDMPIFDVFCRIGKSVPRVYS
ncbi:MAG: alanine racemase [Rubrivivax sp.]